MELKALVKIHLEQYPETQDDFDLLIGRMTMDSEEIYYPRAILSIDRLRRQVQKENPLLRGNKYQERQIHARTVANKMRNQERPENLEKVYEDVTDKLFVEPSMIDKLVKFIWN